MLTSNGDLTIVQVHQTDSGTYVCVASNGLGEPVRREVGLQVTGELILQTYICFASCLIFWCSGFGRLTNSFLLLP